MMSLDMMSKGSPRQNMVGVVGELDMLTQTAENLRRTTSDDIASLAVAIQGNTNKLGNSAFLTIYNNGRIA